MFPLRLILFLLFGVICSQLYGQDRELREQAKETLFRATLFFHDEVSTNGGYLWRYSDDLTKREGEGRVGETTAWVQPPGTPAVGMAFLKAYRLTGEDYLLDAAKSAAAALIQGQLRSGGWTANIEFDAEKRKRFAYRTDPVRKSRGVRNVTSLDDDMTQSALRFLMELDATLNHKDEKINEAVQYALASVLAAQYPNGSWPQGYSQPPSKEDFPVLAARYPDSWSRSYRGHNNYWNYYTLNDNVLRDMISTLFLAKRIYGDDKFFDAATRGADFILLAQMPDPQPAWAQQYDVNMSPAWARKFEPPSITGGESQGILRTLLMVYLETGDPKYLEPIPRAIEYLQSSRLDDGQLARFYELKTNKPLFFTAGDYQLTYDDDNMPTHYAFKIADQTDKIYEEYERLARLDDDQLAALRSGSDNQVQLNDSLTKRTRQLIESIDDRGAWVEPGGMKYFGSSDDTSHIIDCRTFNKNVETLAKYIAASK